MVDNFLSDSECEHLIALGKRREKQIRKMRPLLQAMSQGKIDESLQPGHMIEWKALAVPDTLARDVEERIGRLMGAPPHALDGGIKLAQTLMVGDEAYDDDNGGGGGRRSRVPEGCHLDINRHEHRWGTCIIYLASLEASDGGETCFPLAKTPSASSASAPSTPPPVDSLASDAALLARAGILHTENALGDGRRPITEAAQRLLAASERTAWGQGGLAVRPMKGTACIFYTRDAEGAVDPQSFHFGAAVRNPAVEKWTCQIFKALPQDARVSDAERRAFMKAVHPLAVGQREEDGEEATASRDHDARARLAERDQPAGRTTGPGADMELS